MKRILFIDRDGTLIREPKDEQIDSLEKLEFLPGVFASLSRIARSMPYELIMVSNQDGLGTESFPEDTFWPAHNKMLDTLKGEDIEFSEILVDRSFDHENLPTRKPGTGLLTHIIRAGFDKAGSFVIGDRLSDVELAKNLECRAILIDEKNDSKLRTDAKASYPEVHLVSGWSEVFSLLKDHERTAEVRRTTSETDITISLNLNGSGKSDIGTGMGFFDHMLQQIAKHGNIDLNIKVKGDLHIDEHHTIEDTGLALGQAFEKALGNKKGIGRYGFSLPMDDCLAQVALDFGGRPWLVWEADFKREKIGEMPTEMFHHFFKSFSDTSKSNINISATGDNEHHKIEAIFKAFARAIRMGLEKDYDRASLPSTKGSL